ncbi:Threonine/homoserine efflux transporter RhtA [Chitinophaga sp. YR573]|uniref:EamA family transporter n=1 Tax=Chitinophaga sp. YR573 TaxID=1881040 RepID=UPI0008C33D2A|nr:DMT family transporter [Chitinophaga sp. YR573]SEW37866.1 Threonine/homoserine efflux transporter RhtA [Chitinophaga sp. YR573]
MKNFKYILMVLIGGVMYGTMSSFVKLFYSWGYNAAELSFSQALLAAAFLGIFLLLSRKRKFSKQQVIPLLITGGTIGLTNYLYYQSVSYISASLAIVILMQFTWFSLLLEWALFRKKPGRPELLTVVFILIGTVMAGNLFYAEKLSFSWKGLTFVLCSSLTYAIYIVANSRVGKNVNWLPKSTMIMTGSALAIFIVNANTILAGSHFSYEFLLIAVFLAVIGTSIPTALFAAGIPKIGAGVSSILMTVELPVAIICATIVLNEHTSVVQIAGILIMLIAISAMNYYKSLIIKKEG